VRKGSIKPWWDEQMSKLAELYRRYAHRQARLERARVRVGTDAFLSGHEGWFFHRGLRDKPDQRE
jgi:hypothetical protein